MVANKPRSARIELRTTEDAKELLLRAASESGSDLTSFILNSALTSAREVVESVERIELSRRDAIRVLELLENPGDPPPALIESARRLRERRVRVD
ncbi:MAG: DUF1778 domain-containing protein [Dehalococcoidia bacterium]|nr:DUF1778 domain-containing protein [Dehalococcoidia bacterium]